MKKRDDREDVEPDEDEDDTETTGPAEENEQRVEKMFAGKKAWQQADEYIDE
jgi:hypothetical protein